ncbi:hypothetical protein RF679_03275 [Undibacterium cyanobacteriorum]|uniref:Uncharacterized protein n=1 Tax=Undibacterium cyanobacteriorum TaxID=3073561 RepID=A0ABY9RLN6_9BURK|nr:hypothetical protein [Undibacterium sp. 20NA77.5]WMW81312.1 hypothetical protein RF679_03275 [Undibacterium sp. 20NA77.5]
MSDSEYRSLMLLFQVLVDDFRERHSELLTEENSPVKQVRKFEAKSLSQAKRSLMAGLSDFIEFSLDWSAARVASLDAACREKGIITFSE